MGEVRLSLPPASVDLVVDGRTPLAWRRFFEGVWRRLGGPKDNVFSAFAAALAAIPSGTEVVASAGLQFGGAIGGNVPIGLYKAMAAVADLPATGNHDGDHAYALDGRNSGEGAGAGKGCEVIWTSMGGGMWHINGIGTAVTA